MRTLLIVLALGWSSVAAAEMLRNAAGQIVWVADDQVTQALVQGYTRPSTAETAEQLTKREPESAGLPTAAWIIIGGAAAIGLTSLAVKRWRA